MRKESWEVNKAGEASELEPLSLDTITEAIEPGEEIEWGTPTLHSMDKGESFPGTYSSPSHLPGYSTTEEHPVMIQQVGGAAEMGEINRIIKGDDPEVPMHAPGESHASDEPSPMGGEAKPGTNIEAAIKYPESNLRPGPKC